MNSVRLLGFMMDRKAQDLRVGYEISGRFENPVFYLDMIQKATDLKE